MKNIAVVFGGKSVEHDISIITGLQIIKNLNPNYNVIPIYIFKNGEWFTGEKLIMMSSFTNFSKNGLSRCFFVPHSQNLFIKGIFKTKQKPIDSVMLALHGANGEDGSIQGLLQLCEIPFSSSGIMGSAITMDKVATKMILQSQGINTSDYLWFFKSKWQTESKTILKEIKQKFKSVVVKPARAGSSIGVTKCKTQQEIKEAVELALCYDNKIIVEQFVEGFREINIACCGKYDDVELSCIEEIENNANILDFDKKYINAQNTTRKVDVKLEDKMEQTLKQMATKAFIACGCGGVVRMDFFVQNDQIILNEINSIPGSMANYLFKGQTFTNLLEKILLIAEEEQNERKKLLYQYSSTALVNFEQIPEGKLFK